MFSGLIGSTGYSTGPHLDLRFWMNGHPIDPLKVKAPPVEPIKPEIIATYQEFLKTINEKLDSIPLMPVFPQSAIESIGSTIF